MSHQYVGDTCTDIVHAYMCAQVHVRVLHLFKSGQPFRGFVFQPLFMAES